MRKLTISDRIYESSFNSLERKFGYKFPNYFKDFMKTYADLSVEERIYFDKEKDKWKVNKFCMYKTMFEFSEEFLKNNLGYKVPFGFDPGGWIFCICLDENDYNSVYIYRFTDHLPEEAFLKIADSFEEFIDGLQPESEVS